jgi:hypothetical protein
MAEQSSAIFWVLNCPIYLLRCYKSVVEGFHDAITYFRNHHHQMHYVEAIAANLPIGSGITEAACKVIIKARLCCSGMKWKDRCDRISIK